MAFRREKKSENITLASPKVWVVSATAIFQLLISDLKTSPTEAAPPLHSLRTTNTPLTQQNKPSSPSLVHRHLSTTPSLILTTSTEQKTIHNPVVIIHHTTQPPPSPWPIITESTFSSTLPQQPLNLISSPFLEIHLTYTAPPDPTLLTSQPSTNHAPTKPICNHAQTRNIATSTKPTSSVQ